MSLKAEMKHVVDNRAYWRLLQLMTLCEMLGKRGGKRWNMKGDRGGEMEEERGEEQGSTVKPSGSTRDVTTSFCNSGT